MKNSPMRRLAAAITLLSLTVLIGTGCTSQINQETVTIKVTEKERVEDRSGSGSRYLIWTDDETFENTDSILEGKFNSSDLYGHLKVGGTYSCKVGGMRIAVFSMYRNLLECDPA